MNNTFWFLLFLFLPFCLEAQIQSSLRQKEEAERFFKSSEYDSAAYHYEKAITLCKSCPDTFNVRLNLTLFKTYMYGERLEEGYQRLTHAETYAKKAKSDEYFALLYISFAEYFRSTQKYEKADAYLNKANQIISKKTVSDEVLALYYNRKAAILSEGHDDCNGILAYSLKSIEISRKINDKDLEAASLNEMGFAYEKTSPPDLEKSISCYLQAVGILEKREDDLALANALGNLVRVYLKNNQYDLALKYNTIGYELAEKKKIEYWLTVFTFHQYKIYRHQNKLTLALKTLEKYDKLNTEYTRKYWVKTSARAENEYETKQKDQELKLNILKLKNKELELKKNKQNRIYFILAILFVSILSVLIFVYSVRTRRTNNKLQSLLNENQFLLGESNHRIKNNLQLIIALIYQEMEKQKVDFEDSALFEIVGKIEAVSSLHKQLYTNDSKQMIRIDTYLEEIKVNFDNFFRKRGIEVTFNVESLEISINKSLYLGILCTELILNSLKHAFNQQNTEKRISLILKKEQGRIMLRYSDSGPGLKSHDTPLKLVHLMSQQLRFEYKIHTTDYFLFEADLTGTL